MIVVDKLIHTTRYFVKNYSTFLKPNEKVDMSNTFTPLIKCNPNPEHIKRRHTVAK